MSKIIQMSPRYLYLFPYEQGVDRMKLQITDEGIYSISKLGDPLRIMKIIKRNYKEDISKSIITDGTANIGGDTINFAQFFKTVNSVEITRLHCAVLENNIKVYNRNNVNIICNSYLKVMNTLKQDIIYLDPPWGGPDYYKKKSMKLYLGKYEIADIVKKIKKRATLFVIKAPTNYNYQSFFKKIGSGIKKGYILRKKVLILIFKPFI
jgi:predicted RNA methylase